MTQGRQQDWLRVVYGAARGGEPPMASAATGIHVRQSPAVVDPARAPGGSQRVRITVVPSDPGLVWSLYLRDFGPGPGDAPRRASPGEWTRARGSRWRAPASASRRAAAGSVWTWSSDSIHPRPPALLRASASWQKPGRWRPPGSPRRTQRSAETPQRASIRRHPGGRDTPGTSHRRLRRFAQIASSPVHDPRPKKRPGRSLSNSSPSRPNPRSDQTRELCRDASALICVICGKELEPGAVRPCAIQLPPTSPLRPVPLRPLCAPRILGGEPAGRHPASTPCAPSAGSIEE